MTAGTARAGRRRRLSPTVAVWLVALAIHLLAVVDYGNDPFRSTYVSDALSYDQWGRRLAAEGLGNEPVFHQSPLYPLLLGTIYRAAGNDPAAWVLLVQALLGSLAVALLVPVGHYYFDSRRAGVAAAAIALLHGPLLFHGLKLLPVSLALATLSAALAALGLARARPGRATALLAGAAWGLAFLTRSETLLFVPLALAGSVWLLLRERRHPTIDQLGRIAIGALAAATIVAPVTLHNVRRGDRVLIAASAGENLFIGNQRGADGGHTPLDSRAGDLFSQRAVAQLLAAEALGEDDPLPSQVSRYWTRRALEEIAADPAGWFALEGRKLLRAVVASDPADMYSFHLERRRFLPLLFVLPLPAAAVWLLAAAGLWLARQRRRGGPVAALAIGLATALMIFFVSSRLRAPLLFVLAVFAGLAVVHGWERWRSGHRGAVLLFAVPVLLLTILDLGAGRPGDRETLRLASVLSLQDRTAESLSVLQPLLTRAAPDPIALDQAGWVHYKRRELEQAVSHYERALTAGAEGSRRAQIHSRIALAETARGRFDAAGRAHDAAVAADPSSAGAHYERAKFRMARDDREGAIADLRHAAELEPAWSEPRAALEALGVSAMPLRAP